MSCCAGQLLRGRGWRRACGRRCAGQRRRSGSDTATPSSTRCSSRGARVAGRRAGRARSACGSRRSRRDVFGGARRGAPVAAGRCRVVVARACHSRASVVYRVCMARGRAEKSLPGSVLGSILELGRDCECYGHIMTVYFHVVSSVGALNDALKSRFFGLTSLSVCCRCR